MENVSKTDGVQSTTMGVLVHLIGFMSGPFGTGLVIRLSKNEFTEANARNALNWQLTVSGAIMAAVVMGLVLVQLSTDAFWIYVGLGLIVVFFNFASCLLAAYRATQGKAWEYPFEQKFV